MSWLRIDDGFPEHEKMLALSVGAKWLHVVALCQCASNLTDGHIDPVRLKVICAIAAVSRPRSCIAQLVGAGLWIECGGGGHDVKDYLEYNPSGETVKKEQAKARERMQDLRKRRSSSDEPSGARSGEHSGEGAGEVRLPPAANQEEQELELQELDLEEIAAEGPVTESEFRSIIASMPGADENVIWPLAERVNRDVFLANIQLVFDRKPRNPAGLLVTRLRAAVRAAEQAARIAEEPRIAPPQERVLRLAPDLALMENVRAMARNGHEWNRVEKWLLADPDGPRHLDEARAAYDEERTAA